MNFIIQRVEIPAATPEKLAKMKQWTIEPVQDVEIWPPSDDLVKEVALMLEANALENFVESLSDGFK